MTYFLIVRWIIGTLILIWAGIEVWSRTMEILKSIDNSLKEIKKTLQSK